MKIFELAATYDEKRIRQLRNKNPLLLRGIDGERILIAHGAKDGYCPGAELFKGMYDILISCWITENEQVWTNFFFLEINGEKRGFLTVKKTSEQGLLFNSDATIQEIKQQFGE
jgi:hypothetical protein